MMDQITLVLNSIIASFIHIWPYLLITIPLAVAVQMSGAARYIRQVFQAKPVIAIFLATAIGAFSPFCSCGVIPVIAALLISGVPLAPVMSFWIASPSMDPEMFFLSVSTLGWNLALWRLGATLGMSLAAGFIAHFAVKYNWLGDNILRTQQTPQVKSYSKMVKQWFVARLNSIQQYTGNRILFTQQQISVAGPDGCGNNICCTAAVSCEYLNDSRSAVNTEPVQDQATQCGCNTISHNESFIQRLIPEIIKSTTMVIRFMTLAFFIQALITLYVPANLVVRVLGSGNAFSIVIAALVGIPMYTGNMTALPMMSGLLAQGMSPAAVLAFLIAGPTTTLPAMAAVWGIAHRRVFILYLGIALFNALFFGFLYYFVVLL
ncbi:MAG TPA: permease [bacterium]|nr:permease [bacterium]HPN42117.1 permease [bacterium]